MTAADRRWDGLVLGVFCDSAQMNLLCTLKLFIRIADKRFDNKQKSWIQIFSNFAVNFKCQTCLKKITEKRIQICLNLNVNFEFLEAFYKSRKYLKN